MAPELLGISIPTADFHFSGTMRIKCSIWPLSITNLTFGSVFFRALKSPMLRPIPLDKFRVLTNFKFQVEDLLLNEFCLGYIIL